MGKKYFSEDAAVLASVLDFLDENKLVKCSQRFRVIRYLLDNADENGIIRTTYKRTATELGKHSATIELNSVGNTFRLLINAGLIAMNRTNHGTRQPTEYEIQKDVLHEIISRYKSQTVEKENE